MEVLLVGVRKRMRGNATNKKERKQKKINEWCFFGRRLALVVKKKRIMKQNKRSDQAESSEWGRSHVKDE